MVFIKDLKTHSQTFISYGSISHPVQKIHTGMIKSQALAGSPLSHHFPRPVLQPLLWNHHIGGDRKMVIASSPDSPEGGWRGGGVMRSFARTLRRSHSANISVIFIPNKENPLIKSSISRFTPCHNKPGPIPRFICAKSKATRQESTVCNWLNYPWIMVSMPAAERDSDCGEDIKWWTINSSSAVREIVITLLNDLQK